MQVQGLPGPGHELRRAEGRPKGREAHEEPSRKRDAGGHVRCNCWYLVVVNGLRSASSGRCPDEHSGSVFLGDGSGATTLETRTKLKKCPFHSAISKFSPLQRNSSKQSSFDSSSNNLDEDDVNDAAANSEPNFAPARLLPRPRNPLLTNGNGNGSNSNNGNISSRSSSGSSRSSSGGGGGIPVSEENSSGAGGPAAVLDAAALECMSAEDLRGEVEVLQSRVRELEASLKEKDNQLSLRDSQVRNVCF